MHAIGGRFDLLAEIGRGGMGIVYKARDREANEIVALKVLKPEIATRPELVERFKTELRLARKITHKNVCRTYDLHRFGDTVVIAMEFIEGESLRAILARYGGVPLRRGLQWATQVCAGLSEAHSQGVIHRDLKPENILIDRESNAKVMDFGIARSIETEAAATGTVIGTPAYMSPEQAEGKPADARSDIYSLGLVLYEMFTGHQALRAETPVALALKQIHETPPTPREVEPDVPYRIDRAIQKCLEKKPEKRFQRVTELEAALTEKPEAKPAAAAGEEVELPLSLTRWQRSDWLLVGAALAGLALFFPFFNRTSPAPRNQVTFDRGALRRIAEEYAQRLGAPLAGSPSMQLWWVGGPHDYVAEGSGAQAGLDVIDNPAPFWVWVMEWANGTQVRVDHRGSLVSFSREAPQRGVVQRLPADDAKLLAEKSLREFYSRDPSLLSLETTLYDVYSGQPATSFVWLDPNDYHGLNRRYTVRLVGRETASLDEIYNLPPSYWEARQRTGWQAVGVMAFFLILLILGISQRRLVDPSARWRMAFVGFMFLFGMYSGVLAIALGGGGPSLLTAVFFGVAFAFGVFFDLVAVERSMRRVWPAKLSSLIRLFGHETKSEPCGLAILRGTLVGLGLLGVDALLVWIGTRHLGMRLDGLTQTVEPARSAMIGTGWSVGFVATKELFQAATVGVIVSFFASFFARLARRRWLALFAAAILAAVCIPGPFFNMAAVQPYPGKLAFLTLECLVLAWALARFDVLTVMWAVFTFAFCWANYTLLVMFEPTGAFEEWAGFAVFTLFVAAAAVIAFKSPLRAAYRRAVAAVE